MNSLRAAGHCLRPLCSALERGIQRARQLGHPVAVACSFEVDPVDPLHMLRFWDDGETPYLYWESPDSEVSFFAWGCALELSAQGLDRFAQVSHAWQRMCESAVSEGELPLRLCGGFRFDPQSWRHPLWEGFGDASLMLARFTVVRQQDKYQLLYQHVVGGDDDALALAANCCLQLWPVRQSAEGSAQPQPSVEEGAMGTMDRKDWEAKVEEAVQNIRQGRLGKVVLARAHCAASGGLDPWRVIEQLRRQHSDAHLFACRRGDACFLGASPEILAHVKDGQLRTHALAGTTIRSTDAQEDVRLGQALLESAKDRHEHQLVVDAICKALQPCCHAMEVSQTPELKRLSRVQHLNTPIRAQLTPDTGVLGILEAMHPTPAVGGYPRNEAVDYIRHHEGWDRGWYAGPLGWLDSRGNGHFVVALRSALLRQRHSYLFAGCGLVGDSVPCLEYEETRVKLSVMQSALSAAQGCPGREAMGVRLCQSLVH